MNLFCDNDVKKKRRLIREEYVAIRFVDRGSKVLEWIANATEA
jgi:hypothetical protein